MDLKQVFEDAGGFGFNIFVRFEVFGHVQDDLPFLSNDVFFVLIFEESFNVIRPHTENFFDEFVVL